MSTPGDEEGLLSDSSVTDVMGNQVDDVDRQLVIIDKNIVAEKLEEEEVLEKKGDSVGIDVSDRSNVARVNFTGEKPKEDTALVKQANGDKAGMDLPGRSIIAQVESAGEKPKEDFSQVKDSVGIEVHGRGVVKTQEEEKEDARAQKKEKQEVKTEEEEKEDARAQEKEKQEVKTQEEEKEDTRAQEKEKQEVKTEEGKKEEARAQEKEEQKSKTQEEEKKGVQNEVDKQEEAKITKRAQETVGSPPTYEKATDDVPRTSKITPKDAETAVKKVGGANVFHLFFYHMEKDAELPEGDYACNGSCSCNCGGSSCKCVIGYQFNKIKVASLIEGPTTAAIQWDDKKHPNITLIVKALMLLFYFIILLFSFLHFFSKIYKSAQKSQFLFDTLTAFFSFVGTTVSLIALLVFFGRRCEETIQCWNRLFGCVKALCTRDHIRLTCCGKDCICCGKSTEATKHITDTLEDRMKGSRCCGCCSTQLQGLNRGKWATIIGNFSEMFLTVLDESISTVIIVLSLYTFIGRQQYRVFYIVTEWTEVTDIIKIIASCLIFLASHIKRVSYIAMNINKFDKDIAKIPEEKLKRNCCQRFFGFQGRLVVHAFLLSLLQVYCMLALAWKIIRDHCISEEEARNTAGRTVINGTAFNSTLPTVFEFGPLGGCSVPSFQPATVNSYTIYNIFYVSMLLPILSYILLFVSNIPFFVEYCQLLHASGIYKFERAVEESEKEEVERVVNPHPFLEILAAFIDVRNQKCKFTGEDLKRKKDEIRQKRKKVQKDIIYGLYKDMKAKNNAICTSIPTVILGVIHLVLFYFHIGFLTCRYSPQFGVSCFFAFDAFSVFTQSLSTDVMVLVVLPVILICWIGFPGPLVTMMWIGIIVGIFLLVGSAVIIFVAILYFVFMTMMWIGIIVTVGILLLVVLAIPIIIILCFIIL